MNLLSFLIIGLIGLKALLLIVTYFLWRSSTRLRDTNRMIFLMKRGGTINEKNLEELKNSKSIM
jgi:hypothetical protein